MMQDAPNPIRVRIDRLPPALRSRRARLLARLRRAALRLQLSWSGMGPGLRRTVDVVACTVGLILAAPLLAVAAILVKATSRGPVFFPQERVGLQGRRFMMYKLRSMRVGGDALK